ncbi:hypothetical protein EUTSA_v10015703mg, partial [Eutrema salsugineum]
MRPSININSISVDLAGAANETDMENCNHFSMRSFVAETRQKEYRKCWPFDEESLRLVNQNYYLPSLSGPKFKWWRCTPCVRDINADETQGKAIVQNEDVNCERSQKNYQPVAATGIVIRTSPPRPTDVSTVRSKSRKVASPEQVSNKKLKEKVNKPSMDVSSRKEKQNVDQAVTTFESSEIAGVVEDAPSKATKNRRGSRVPMESDNVSSEGVSELQRRKTRKVRRMDDLLADDETKIIDLIRAKDSSSKMESGRGRKRKLLPENNYVRRELSTVGATSENASKSCEDAGQGDTELTEEEDPIRGKKKNRRFQVVDELLPTLPCETSQEGIRDADAGPSKSALPTPVQSLTKEKDSQRPEKKLASSKKKNNKPAIDNGKSTPIGSNSGGNQVKPRTGPSINASSQSTRDSLNEKSVGGSFEERLASEGYVRKSVPQLKEKPDLSLRLQSSGHVRSKEAEANYRQEIAGPSCELQMDGSVKEITTDQERNFPREVLELLAKNQYERTLPDKEDDVRNKQPQETAPPKSNGLLIDLNETYDNGNSLEDNVNNTSRPPQPSESNARKEERFPIGNQQQRSIGFAPVSQPFVPSPFARRPPPQPNRPSSIRFTGHNSQWHGNLPTMAPNPVPTPSSYRVLRPCNTCQSIPPYRETAAAPQPVWPSSMMPPQHRPVSFNVQQQPYFGMHPQNLNFNGMQRCGYTPDLSFGCKHAAAAASGASRANSSRTMDAFASDSSMPAMELLSHMDPRVRPNTPAGHHGNTNFTRRHFPPVNQFQTGESSRSAYQTKQLPFDPYGNRVAPPEPIRTTFPIVRPPPSFSIHNAEPSWSQQHQVNRSMRTDTVAPVYGSLENQVFPRRNEQGRIQLLGASGSLILPLKSHMAEKEKELKRKAESSSNASTRPLKISSGSMECSLNRNPADFTTLDEPGNVYMLTGEMLTGENSQARKRAPYKKKTSLAKKQ